MYGKSLWSWCHAVPSTSSDINLTLEEWQEETGRRKAGEGWKQEPPGARKKAPSAPEHLQLLNRVTARKLRRSWLCFHAVHLNPGPQRSSRRKQQLIVVNDSLLQGPEALTCCTEKFAALQGLKFGLLCSNWWSSTNPKSFFQ